MDIIDYNSTPVLKFVTRLQPENVLTKGELKKPCIWTSNFLAKILAFPHFVSIYLNKVLVKYPILKQNSPLLLYWLFNFFKVEYLFCSVRVLRWKSNQKNHFPKFCDFQKWVSRERLKKLSGCNWKFRNVYQLSFLPA